MEVYIRYTNMIHLAVLVMYVEKVGKIIVTTLKMCFKI